MTLSDKKLYCGSKKDNTITDTVKLYTNLSDVQNQGKLFKFNNEDLYAKWGELNNPQASKIHCKIDGVEKALLRQARIVWGFNDVKLRYKEGSASVGNTGVYITGTYNPNNDEFTEGELQYDVSIPPGAKNIKVKWDWVSNGSPFVDMDWFDKKLSLDASSETSGHFEFSLPNGASNWDNRVKVGSYALGTYSKAWIVRDFSIEFDLDVPIIKHELVDDFNTNRNILIYNKDISVDVINNACRFRLNPGEKTSVLKYNIRDSYGYNNGFDQSFNYDLISIPPNTQIGILVEYQIEGKTLSGGSALLGTKTFKVSPNVAFITLTFKMNDGSAATSTLDCIIDNVKLVSYWT